MERPRERDAEHPRATERGQRVVTLQEGAEVHGIPARHGAREHVRVRVPRHRADRDLVGEQPQYAVAPRAVPQVR